MEITRSKTSAAVSLSRKRISRSLVTVVVLGLFNSPLLPSNLLPSASAVIVTTGTCSVDGTNMSTSNVIDNTASDGTCTVRFMSGTSSFLVPTGINTVAALVVGGGGGGGFGGNGGGGGAGAVISSDTGVPAPPGTSISGTVGGGGTSGHNSNQDLWTKGGKGIDSSLTINASQYVASGGGGGSNSANGVVTTADNGGSGGGKAINGFGPGSGFNLDYAGWTERVFSGASHSGVGGGGGGGAGGSPATNSSNGAVGVTIFGYSVGGGGSGWQGGSATAAAPFGGGAPRDGSYNCPSATCNGDANTGGGGGGGGAGGSGVIVIKFVQSRGQGTIAQTNGFQVNRNTTFTFTRTGTAPASTSASFQWQVKPSGSSTWSNVTTGTGGTTTTYQTPVLGSSNNGSAYRIAVTDTQATYGISATTFTETSAQTLFTPPGSDTDTALMLNGTSQFADVADTTGSAFDMTGTFTLQAWVKPANTCPGQGAVISKNVSYMLYCQAGVWKVMALTSGTGGTGDPTSISVEPNQWHHIAISKTSTSRNILFYYDGVLAQTISTAANVLTMTPNNNPFQIGQYTGSFFFNGQIDQVHVYNTQRTQTQIAADMNAYGFINDSALMAYYDFNEGSEASTLYNRKSGASSATDLTIRNSPISSDIKTDSTTGVYTVVEFPRTYITSTGGWRTPSGVTRISALVVGGGGGGAGRGIGTEPGAGGGGGGVFEIGAYPLASGSNIPIVVGVGGRGGLNADPNRNSIGRIGGTTTFGLLTAGGGGGATYDPNDNTIDGSPGTAGGGGGGASVYFNANTFGAGGAAVALTIGGVTYPGRSGGNAAGYSGSTSGGGGGAGGAASFSTPGIGITSSITGITYGRGGLGGGGTAHTFASPAAIAGNGGDGYSVSTPNGNVGVSGASGLVVVRWITALKPSFTPPTNAFLNAGMTETFTTNVAQDSATVTLTRTFRWESSTAGINGPYSVIKQGTGAANASFSWVPQDTRTSGSTFAYRVIVTDSDTAGLFIVDTSTAVWAVINPALRVSGSSTITKRINLSKNETFTITLGTSTYRSTLSPVIPGITLDTSTAGIAVIRIADTVTVGTYYETLTVIDSVSASVVTPLIIQVAAPPNLLYTGEIVSDNLVFNLDAGNSASLIGESGTATTGLAWNDLSGSKVTAATGAGVNTGASAATSCAAPTYSSENGGALQFSANSDNCYYVSSFTGRSLVNNYTVEAWFKTSSSLANGTSIVTQSFSGSNVPINIFISANLNGNLIVGFYDQISTADRFANCPYTPVVGAWTHIAGTYDGTTLTTYINGSSNVSGAGGCTSTQSYTPSGNTNPLGMLIGKGRTGAPATAFPGSISTIRMYNKSLTAAQILANFNATKSRFDSSNNALVRPTKKYGTTLLESFTATSGLDTKTVTFSVGDRAGIDWDTTTVSNRVNLTMQESLTVGTFIDTATVTDSLGQSTYLPIRMNVTKADSLTVTMSAATTVTYNGSAITVYPRATVTGLKWTDTATSLSRFSSALYAESTVAPTNADTYTVRGNTPSFTLGSLDNYLGIIYETATARINQAKQRPLNIFMYGGTVGLPYPISLQGGDGTGAVTETLTGVSTLTGCSIGNRILTASEQKQGFCEVRVVKAGDQNYFAETQTVQLYFMAYVNNQLTGLVGSGSTIALNGATSFETSTIQAPSITGLSTTTISLGGGGTLTITGTGFTGAITVKFWRNKAISVTSSNGTTIDIPVSSIASVGATSGRIAVITTTGEAVSLNSLSITP